ncbi:MAG TPA: septation protein A [Geminicoccaceae bacterium]|nr:septation protein A [Geminicoccaceae bacterium]
MTRTPRWLRPAVDYGPLAAFFLTYVLYGLMAATAVVIGASLAAALAAWALERRLPLIPLITAAVVAVFGGLTLWLHDETFIKMKPTIVQALFAAVLLGGLVLKRPLLKPLLGSMLPPMSDRAWGQLTLRYALFFIAMGLLNELVWRSQSTDVWVSFKVFGLPLLTILFIASQLPFLNRHAGQAARLEPEPRAAPSGAVRLRPKGPGG